MVKWVVELGEHEIDHNLRRAIKDQTLTCFLAETYNTPKEGNSPNPSETWKMFVDGTFGDQWSGAEIVLISAHEDELTYAL